MLQKKLTFYKNLYKFKKKLLVQINKKNELSHLPVCSPFVLSLFIQIEIIYD